MILRMMPASAIIRAMRVCPKCNRRMKRRPYERIEIWSCAGCGGALVFDEDLEKSKHDRDLSRDQLAAGLTRVEHSDTDRILNCTQCLRPMSKAHYRQAEPEAQRGLTLDFHVDFCSQCEHFFLDAGELEAIQLSFEQSEAGRRESGEDGAAPPEAGANPTGAFGRFLARLLRWPG